MGLNIESSKPNGKMIGDNEQKYFFYPEKTVLRRGK
ncbi:MAG: hypothetical protein ACJAUO_001644 [Sediminicola sp.]|jgi:hypothetical protein